MLRAEAAQELVPGPLAPTPVIADGAADPGPSRMTPDEATADVPNGSQPHRFARPAAGSRLYPSAQARAPAGMTDGEERW